MHNNCNCNIGSGDSQFVDSFCESINSTEVNNTVLAGDVRGGSCDGSNDGDCQGPLAKIYFKSQEYVAGFCPDEALERGTMFPELVRLFK